MSAYDWLYELCQELWGTEDDAMADTLFEFGGAASNVDLDKIDSLYPVLVAFARERRLPWVELFARHVRLQAYLNSGTRAGKLLPDVIETLAMTGREDLRDCPQSICAIQDLSICYSAIDAPGYAQERIRAIDEVVPTLSPGLDCASCLMGEKMNALSSLGRYAEALDYGRAWAESARLAGVDWNDIVAENDTKLWDWITAALGAGDLDLAQSLLERMEAGSEQSGLWKRVRVTMLTLAQGRPAEAALKLPAFDAVADKYAGLRRDWLEVAFALFEAGALANTQALRLQAAEVAAQSLQDGRLRDAFNSEVDTAFLCLDAKEGAAATPHIERAAELRGQLRGSFGADERLSALKAAAR